MDEANSDGTLNLHQWRRRFPGGRVPLERALDVLKQLMKALHEAHISSPFHRDVIPSTIEVVEHADGTETFAVPDLVSVAENHGEPGARRYLAPEQWRGSRQNTFTDQYALAALFVELVTGEVPFAHAFATEDETVMKTATCEHAVNLPEDCPRRDVLLRALSKNPRARYSSCSAFGEALEDPERAEMAQVVGGHRGHGAHAHHHSHSHSHSTSRHAQSHRHGRRVWPYLFLVAALGSLAFWGVQSGWLDQLQDPRGPRARAIAAAREQREQAEKSQVLQRAEQLERIGEEIRRQQVTADNALKDLENFLQSGGPAVVMVERDAVALTVKRAKSELADVERDLESARRQEASFVGLRTGARTFDGESAQIQKGSGLWQVYTNLVAEGRTLETLTGQFTEAHPQVKAQRKVYLAARRRLAAALESAHEQVKSVLSAKTIRRDRLLDALRVEETRLATLEQSLQVAQMKQNELEKARARESQMLVDLRLREHELRFGALAPAVTNRLAR